MHSCITQLKMIGYFWTKTISLSRYTNSTVTPSLVTRNKCTTELNKTCLWSSGCESLEFAVEL